MFLNYGGHELTDYIKVMDVKRPVLPTRKNYSVDIPSMMGEHYTGFKYGAKTIEVDYALIGSSQEEYFNYKRILGNLLDQNIPTKLIIGDEPDKYYYAVIDGDTDLDKVVTCGIGTLTFICHNPVAYSTEDKIFDSNAEGIVTIENGGSAKTQPLINAQFSQDAQFLQVTNYDGKVLLIGNRTNVDNEDAPMDPIVLNEPCEVTTNFTTSGNVLDSGREVLGNCTVNTGGWGICCANYGSSSLGWHGGALRRNLSTSLDEFEIVVALQHDSKGSLKGTGSNATTQPDNGATYKCTANPSLRIRADRSTSAKKLGSIPKNKTVTVTDISKGWGKVTYGGVTGYCSMDYLSKVTTKAITKSTEDPSAENRMGRLEVYGFDSNSQKLFKFTIKDSDQWYEYTDPDIEIGNKIVLSDNTSTPKPQTVTTKNEDGTQTISPTDSGKYGKWNEFDGTFVLKRVRNGSSYLWSCSINKFKDGKTVERLVSNNLSDASFPTGSLNHLVVWFGQYKDNPVVDTMSVSNIKVTRLNATPTKPVNKKIFRSGDEVIIDCASGEILKNGLPYMNDLDIGSEFFSSGKGISQFIVLSDDKNIDVSASITEKWL